MNLGRIVAIVASSAVLSGCWGHRSFSRLPPPEPELVQSPALNVDVNAEIGTSMISAARRAVCPGIKLADTVAHQKRANQRKPYSIAIPRGSLYAVAKDPGSRGGTFYQAIEQLVLSGYKGSTVKVWGGVFVPDLEPEPNATEIYWLDPDHYTDRPLIDDHPGILFERTDVELWGPESFKRELVYGGVSQTTITVLYREFIDNTARPAFSQELKYDLSKGDVIGYRGARFKVLEVTNTGIAYRVLTHLE